MTRLTTLETSQFRKDRKRLLRQRKNLEELLAVIEILADGKILPLKYRDHALTGNWIGFRECHIRPDWLLIYRVEGSNLYLASSGSHGELF